MTDRLAAAEALLADLVGFASISGQPNGDIVNYIKTYLESYGVIVHLDSHEDGQRFNLFASIGPKLMAVFYCRVILMSCQPIRQPGRVIRLFCTNRMGGFTAAARLI